MGDKMVIQSELYAKTIENLLENDPSVEYVKDILANIMHYCYVHEIDFRNELRQAEEYFDFEVEPKPSELYNSPNNFEND